MEISEVVDRARDALSVERVFGQPIQQGESVILPVAKVRGGGGGGSGGAKDQEGEGGGFGLMVAPAGAFVVRGEKIRWMPAVDLNRIVLGGQLVALAGLILFSRVFRAKGRIGRSPRGWGRWR